MAGTVGALDNDVGVVGVAPGARLWAVKVLNSRGIGYTSWIVAGIDWVTAHAETIEVANMSLGGPGFSEAEYDAIQGAVNAGVAFAVAAGNSHYYAEAYSPAAFDNVLTVSALADFDGLPGGFGSETYRDDEDDTLANFSNYGDAVDIAASGVCILSTFPLKEGGYGTISGTSMASRHVAGALALLASIDHPNDAVDVYALYDRVKDAGNDNWTDDSGDGTTEPLLDVSNTDIFAPVLVEVGGGGSTNQAPTASFAFSTDRLTVSFTDASGDADGTVTAWSWDFGDDNTSTAQNPTHIYSAVGDYLVTLTVTDDDGATGTASDRVTVSADEPPSPGSITLTVTLKTAGKNRFAELAWSDATTANVEVRKSDGVTGPFGLLTTTVNDGAYADKLTATEGRYWYLVCEVDSEPEVCSDPATWNE